MLKESILFVASTGLLIYFVTPSDEPSKPEAAREEAQEAVKSSSKATKSAWDYEDADEDDEETFTFGDPTIDLDSDYGESEDDAPHDEDDASQRMARAEETASKSGSADRSNRSAPANDRGSGELGSKDNPIILKSTNPTDAPDD